jgi:hypothetical protein
MDPTTELTDFFNLRQGVGVCYANTPGRVKTVHAIIKGYSRFAFVKGSDGYRGPSIGGTATPCGQGFGLKRLCGEEEFVLSHLPFENLLVEARDSGGKIYYKLCGHCFRSVPEVERMTLRKVEWRSRHKVEA